MSRINFNRNKHARLLVSLFILSLLTAFIPVSFPPPIQYTIVSQQSSLYLEGTTNINQFSCFSVQTFSPSTLEILPTNDDCSVNFLSASMDLKIRNMDCGNKGINRDMHKALKADTHPDIRIKLDRALVESTSGLRNSHQWTPITIDTKITIAGVSKPLRIHLKGKSLSDCQYRFVGSRELWMSDFRVDPPTALMGLVKVDDGIRIHFDLLVEQK